MSFESRAMILIGLANVLFGFGIGIPLTYWIARRFRKRKAVLDRVETTEGEITTSKVERVRNPGRQGPKYKHKPVIEFRYDYDGRTYRSNRQAYNMLFGASGESRANRTARKYNEGERVSVYVDPRNHENGFLEIQDTRQSVVTGIALFVGAMLILMGIAGTGLLGLAIFG